MQRATRLDDSRTGWVVYAVGMFLILLGGGSSVFPIAILGIVGVGAAGVIALRCRRALSAKVLAILCILTILQIVWSFVLFQYLASRMWSHSHWWMYT